MPRNGWSWIGVDDLGDLDGSCELCGAAIRYVYAIEHASWGAMAVGTNCCDKLTQTNEASEHHTEYLKAIDARKRFVTSKRWKVLTDGTHLVRQKGICVEIKEYEDGLGITMDNIAGKQRFDNLLDAKIRVFDAIHSGEAQKFLGPRRKESDLGRIRARLAMDI
jgi:hypothetical protein